MWNLMPDRCVCHRKKSYTCGVQLHTVLKCSSSLRWIVHDTVTSRPSLTQTLEILTNDDSNLLNQFVGPAGIFVTDAWMHRKEGQMFSN